MNMTLISGTVSLIIGIIVTWMTLNLPEASIGLPNAPKAFPGGLGILMVFCSLVLLAREFRRIKREGAGASASRNPHLPQIAFTCLFSAAYALLFNRIGYVLSTFLFLEAELWLFNGRENWKVNTIVALVFSVCIYLLFAKALGVYLPMTPIIWF